MKAVCTRTSRHGKYDDLPLTVGKVYDVVEAVHIPFNPSRQYDYTGPFFKLVNDLGELAGYTDDCVRLLTKAEEREEQLKQIGI